MKVVYRPREREAFQWKDNEDSFLELSAALHDRVHWREGHPCLYISALSGPRRVYPNEYVIIDTNGSFLQVMGERDFNDTFMERPPLEEEEEINFPFTTNPDGTVTYLMPVG